MLEICSLLRRIKERKGNEIYIRDVNVEYSPAVLSYLINNKLEIKKDLPATLLNLCAKGILEIQKNSDGNFNIIDLKNENEVTKLSQDEKYAYKMLLDGITPSKLTCWKGEVKKEYKKHKFSIKHKRPLVTYLLILFAIIVVSTLIYMCATGQSEITGKTAEILSKMMLSPFLGAWIIISIPNIKRLLSWMLKRTHTYKPSFKDTYTKKGAQEYSRWKSFERFMLDFSLINEKDHESVVIWGKYLSYSIALGINQNCDKELYTKIKNLYSFNYNMLENILEN